MLIRCGHRPDRRPARVWARDVLAWQAPLPPVRPALRDSRRGKGLQQEFAP